MPLLLQELYSHYTQQVKDTCASLADPHKAYLLRKAMHYFNTQRQHRQEAHDKPLIEVRQQYTWLLYGTRLFAARRAVLIVPGQYSHPLSTHRLGTVP